MDGVEGMRVLLMMRLEKARREDSRRARPASSAARAEGYVGATRATWVTAGHHRSAAIDAESTGVQQWRGAHRAEASGESIPTAV